jgi:hypothetical protein
LFSSISGTITPWILGTLLLLVCLALAVAVKSWREMKSSPYFFLRRQAEKRLQSYSFVSLGLMVVTAVFAAGTLQAPQDTTPLVAILANAKPASEDIRELVKTPTPLEVASETAFTPRVISTTAEDPFGIDAQTLVQAALTLPQEYDRFEPTAELNDDTKLGTIDFSTKINDAYKAVDPASIFFAGKYTLYATFPYDGMENGMEWAWVWRHDGEVVEGGNELWKYGSDGPGYIYFNPEEGFSPGNYTLEVWVNGELFTRSNLTMTGTALSSGN